jgi:hypothetical protein
VKQHLKMTEVHVPQVKLTAKIYEHGSKVGYVFTANKINLCSKQKQNDTGKTMKHENTCHT